LSRPQHTRLRRKPDRAAYDRPTIDAILDEGLVCHLGFVHEDRPFVIPTLYARAGDVVYVHGSAASRMLRALAGGILACLTVTLVDGLVLARSAFHHSVNYRSVVIQGTALPVTEPAEKERALEAFTEHVVRGRWANVRQPAARELRATAVLRLPIDEASAKARTGPPLDDEPDYELDVWAGVLPLRVEASAPEPDPRLRPGVQPPGYLTRYSRPG
jgi:nitroimidazol reductase NimA-like FMN-containing flavoprotein (pyridoxamine 5'-phosphate oxidase superfamily)